MLGVLRKLVMPPQAADLGAARMEFVAPETFENPVLRDALAHWQALRGERRYPCKEQVSPRCWLASLKDLVLVKVIDGGADFEYRIVGDRLSQAYSLTRHNRHLSEIAKSSPKLASGFEKIYRTCMVSRAPVGIRASNGRAVAAVRFHTGEGIAFPLGPDDETVDHILGVSVYF